MVLNICALRFLYIKVLERRDMKEDLPNPKRFAALLKSLFQQKWVVYAKPAFGAPTLVLRYLGRYTHRVAISNHRLLDVDGERVTFLGKDYAHGNKQKKMTLDATEFLRRFTRHFLPRGFVPIRQFGFLANTRWDDRSSFLAENTYGRSGCPFCSLRQGFHENPSTSWISAWER